ncbi:C4-dicarboxylate ABC transporter [Xaviernesmea oryzae]|uniref:C4-dicarboxylate ABC transporter n=3 Tax=Rhizobium/Agrobacterium group TaxID=227290 RepID=A0A1Q9AWI3_9HYPH|nr:C4-dicarboxylate ABC transporter [Xaviernesmea rhizosphaerae]OLP59778.1 C4-dicarboxylate ABC transporter [Xaviernesmea oryzae]
MQGYVIRNFTPNWFATTMGTGILSVALAQFPGHPWLFAMGQALWLFNILLFATCTTLYTARWLLYFHEASRVFSHSVVSMFFGCIPMGLATIINGFLIYGIPHIGDTAVAIATTLWWIDVTLSLACGLAIPFMMFTRQSHSIDQMTAVWLLPIVASEVAAVSGGLLLPHIADAQTQLTVLMTSLVLWACSVPLAMSVLVILFLRMAVHKLPHVNMAASSWLALGPIGTGALGLLVMSQTGPAVLSANGLASVAPAFGGASFLGAILLWGYGIWWLATAVLITLRYLREGLPFNIGWWGYTFPLGVFAVATLRLSTMVPMSSIAIFGAVLVTALVCMWLLVAAKTIKGTLDRSLFVSPCLKAD